MSVRADRIQKYVRDLILLALPTYGFIVEVSKDKPDLWLILLFFGMASAPAAFGLYALRHHAGTEATPGQPSAPPAQSSQPSSSSSS